MIYEWICGNAPFEGTLTELLTQHLYASPAPLRLRVPSISPAVEQVILKALAKEPRDRFARVQDFVDALEQAGQPIPPHVYVEERRSNEDEIPTMLKQREPP